MTQGKGRKGLPRMCDSLGSRNNSKISITDESKVLESVEAYRHTHTHTNISHVVEAVVGAAAATAGKSFNHF